MNWGGSSKAIEGDAAVELLQQNGHQGTVSQPLPYTGALLTHFYIQILTISVSTSCLFS